MLGLILSTYNNSVTDVDADRFKSRRNIIENYVMSITLLNAGKHYPVRVHGQLLPD
jgi:hypothetical protein